VGNPADGVGFQGTHHDMPFLEREANKKPRRRRQGRICQGTACNMQGKERKGIRLYATGFAPGNQNKGQKGGHPSMRRKKRDPNNGQ